MDNPNEVVPPDFTSDEFIEQRQTFIDLGLTEVQAADSLRSLWTIDNNHRKAVWQQKQREAADAADAAQERADELKRQCDDEDAQFLREERKKNKSKFAPVPDRPVSSCPLILPSLVAVRKLKAHQFCKLWYFSNIGLKEAKASISFAADDNSLALIPSADGSHTFVPSAFAHDKSNVVHDENLSFEQFGQASLRMIDAMTNNSWQQPHVDMHIRFWANIERHEWHYSLLDSQQRALLIYQGNQR